MTTDPATQRALDLIDETTRIALDAIHQMHAADGPPAIEIDDAGVMHGSGVTYVPTVRVQQLATPGAKGERHVEGIVWHSTDTRGCGAVNLAKRIAPPGAARSCHVWIDANGDVAQSASFEVGTWHAGSDTAALFIRAQDGLWSPLSAMQRGKVRGWGANSWAAGIELENVGEVRRVDGKWLGWPFKFGGERPAVVPDDEVRRDAMGASAWHGYTEPQIIGAMRVVSALVRRYGLVRSSCGWSHSTIDPTRRTDPGPLWSAPLARIFARVFDVAV